MSEPRTSIPARLYSEGKVTLDADDFDALLDEVVQFRDAARLSHDRGPVREAAMAFMSHVQSLACDHGTNAGTHTTCPEAMTLYAALSVPAPTLPALDGVITAARALLDAEAEPAYSLVMESQAAREEGRPNREIERMDRVAAARKALREALRDAV